MGEALLLQSAGFAAGGGGGVIKCGTAYCNRTSQVISLTNIIGDTVGVDGGYSSNGWHNAGTVLSESKTSFSPYAGASITLNLSAAQVSCYPSSNVMTVNAYWLASS